MHNPSDLINGRIPFRNVPEVIDLFAKSAGCLLDRGVSHRELSFCVDQDGDDYFLIGIIGPVEITVKLRSGEVKLARSIAEKSPDDVVEENSYFYSASHMLDSILWALDAMFELQVEEGVDLVDYTYDAPSGEYIGFIEVEHEDIRVSLEYRQEERDLVEEIMQDGEEF